MNTRTVTTIFGILFVALGIAGFLPGLNAPLHPGHPPMEGAFQVLGLFPANTLHNIVHAAFGLWGLAASRSLGGSILFLRTVAVVYALLTVLGVLAEPFNIFFGLVPLYGNDIWLHALLAAVPAYFGWVHRSPATL